MKPQICHSVYSVMLSLLLQINVRELKIATVVVLCNICLLLFFPLPVCIVMFSDLDKPFKVMNSIQFSFISVAPRRKVTSRHFKSIKTLHN